MFKFRWQVKNRIWWMFLRMRSSSPLQGIWNAINECFSPSKIRFHQHFIENCIIHKECSQQFYTVTNLNFKSHVFLSIFFLKGGKKRELFVQIILVVFFFGNKFSIIHIAALLSLSLSLFPPFRIYRFLLF